MHISLIGALTIKPYNFVGRPWEFINYNSIDFFDSMASNIKIEIRGRKITRVLPRQNDVINDTWITDKIRFGFDSLNTQRLCNFLKITPLKNINDVGSSKSIQYLSLEIFFFYFLKKYSKKSTAVGGIYGLADSLITSETLILFKDFLTRLGSANLIPSLFNSFNFTRNLRRSSYIFKNNLQNILSADLFIFVGLNPRLESPIINLKLRKMFLKNGTQFFSFTSLNNPNFDVKFLGNSLTAFLMFCEGRHPFSSNIFNYKSFTILLGSSLFYRNDISIFLGLLFKMNKLLSNFSFYSLYSRLTHLLILEYGFVPCKFTNQSVLLSQKTRSNLIFNFSASNYLPEHSEINSISLYKEWASKDINIFFGSFGINSLKFYDYIFPLQHIIESGGTFLSVLGLKEIIPIALTPLKNVQHFDSFYSSLLLYWLKFNFFSYNNKSKNLPNSLRFSQLGVFDTISLVEVSPMLHKLRGLLIKNLISSFSVNPFITDEYTSNSVLMQKAKKSYLSSYPSAYF